MQLTGWEERFAQLGVGLAGMTYDSLEEQAKFHDAEGLGYPLLQDVDTRHVDAWGIRNQEYGPDHFGYGIPHPGMVWLDAEGRVRAKFALPGYRKRPPFDVVHEAIRRLIEADTRTEE